LSTLPFVSVIVVNYNGIDFLPTCLDALKKQTYPRERYELIVSDNHSTDDSLKLLQRYVPQIRILKNERNFGFAKGNNLAIDIAKGEYLVLLNNDTAPYPDWLENLVQVASNNRDVGIVSGHLQLFYDQLIVDIQSDTIPHESETRELGVQVFEVDSGVNKGVYQFLDGFYGWEVDAHGRKFRWTKENAQIGFPVPLRPGSLTLKIKLAAHRASKKPVRIRFKIEDLSEERLLESGNLVDIEIKIPDEIRSKAVPVEQNTGSIVSWAGQGSDRGTYVRQNELFFEKDQGLYEKIEEVFAGCGASMLLKRRMLEDVGCFDDDFFMYYEDTDLSWRARLMGWKTMYAPDAIVRHIHCGTTVEWSPDFIFLTERNRLAMVWKNGRPSQVLRVWIRFILNFISSFLNGFISVLSRSLGARQFLGNINLQLRIMWAIALWLPSLWQKRRAIQKRRVVPFEAVEAWLVK
jgi:GT2 family glycosyltransferase